MISVCLKRRERNPFPGGDPKTDQRGWQPKLPGLPQKSSEISLLKCTWNRGRLESRRQGDERKKGWRQKDRPKGEGTRRPQGRRPEHRPRGRRPKDRPSPWWKRRLCPLVERVSGSPRSPRCRGCLRRFHGLAGMDFDLLTDTGSTRRCARSRSAHKAHIRGAARYGVFLHAAP